MNGIDLKRKKDLIGKLDIVGKSMVKVDEINNYFDKYTKYYYTLT